MDVNKALFQIFQGKIKSPNSRHIADPCQYHQHDEGGGEVHLDKDFLDVTKPHIHEWGRGNVPKGNWRFREWEAITYKQ